MLRYSDNGLKVKRSITNTSENDEFSSHAVPEASAAFYTIIDTRL